jgi:hypothetical protein
LKVKSEKSLTPAPSSSPEGERRARGVDREDNNPFKSIKSLICV